tara:strand:- start:4166 stop:6724 length:2559 start_codon:yes stop_codon:yes gene_type:complete
MKFLNKDLIKNKKFTRSLIILIIFFLGIFTERFDFKEKTINFGSSLFATLSYKIFMFNFKGDKISIDISPKNYKKILESRKKSIEQYRATEDLHKWVPANIKFNNKFYKARIKLKGVHKEHWSHSKKWSFKIKLIDEKSIEGIKRFSIQKPVTRNYLYEWVFMKTLENEGLIAHRNKFIETTVNGDNLGIYYFEEMHTDELIRFNKRREGPIIGLDKQLWIKEANNLKNLGVNNLEDSFWRAKIKAIQFKKSKLGTEQEIYLKQAINLFENFRDGNLRIDEVFDISQLAKLMAAKVIFGSEEFDWRDLKFYYNPITSLLEPIGREVHTSKNFKINSIWWIDNDYLKNIKSEQNQFLKLLFKDREFYQLFLFELNRMTEKNYIKNILDKNFDDYKKYKKILGANNSKEDIFSEVYLEEIRKYIQNTLSPIQGINAYFIKYEKGQILMSVRNIQSLPVKINAIEIKNNEKIELKKMILIDGKKHNLPSQNVILKIPCDDNSLCDESKLKKARVVYNILGQKNLRSSEMSKFYSIESMSHKSKQSIDELSKLSFISINEETQEINFKTGRIDIDQKLVIPENYIVNFRPGTEIVLSKEGIILSYSPINIDGTDKDPIIFSSKSVDDKNNFGYGISIINASKVSKIKNAIFKRLAYPDKMSGYGFSGSINFFNSDVIIKNSKFIKNLRGKDFLNIINSNFEIQNVSFIDTKGDAIDFEFSKGKINNLLIQNVSDDGLDFSGSKVELNKISISSVGDKAISAGEESEIKILDLDINNANIGVTSKDSSNLEIDSLKVTNSKIALLAYQRKLEYGPGTIKVNNIILENNDENYLSQKNSKIFVDNKKVDYVNMDYSIF